METRANHVLIGLFTLGIFIAAFAFVWWFGGNRDTANRKSYQIVFEGSVSGLSRGSSVLFNGIRVGEVTGLDLVPEDPRKIRASVAVGPDTPVRQDTRARLEYQGLTGVGAVALQGGDPNAPELATSQEKPGVIVAESSAVQDLLEGARNIMARADGILAQIEQVVDGSAVPIQESVANVQAFTKALADNSEEVSSFLKSTGEAAIAITEVSNQLRSLSVDAQNIVKAVDPERVRSIVESTDRFAQAIAESGPKLDQILSDGTAISGSLKDASSSLGTTLKSAEEVLVAINADKVRQSVDNITTFSESLARNSGSVDEIVADARQLAERLNNASLRIDGILTKADSLLGEGEDSGLFEEVRQAASSIRTLADNLDKRTATLTNDVSGFTDRGLRDLSGLIQSGRTTLSRVDRVVREIERNPRGFLLGGGGGGGAPEYSPRR